MSDLEKNSSESPSVKEEKVQEEEPVLDVAPLEEPQKKKRAPRVLSEKQKEALAKGREVRKSKYTAAKVKAEPALETPDQKEEKAVCVAPKPARKMRREQSSDYRHEQIDELRTGGTRHVFH